jgi:hypothetical protein
MNVTPNNPAQQGKKGATMTTEENNPDGSRVVPMLEIININAGETSIFATPGEVHPKPYGQVRHRFRGFTH